MTSVDKTVSGFKRNASKIIGLDAADSEDIAKALRRMDGTKNFSKIGGSLAYAVSVAGFAGRGEGARGPRCAGS